MWILNKMLALFVAAEAAEPKSVWTSNKMVALYIALGVVAAAVLTWFFVRKALRTRLQMAQLLTDDPDIDDWLIVFDWTPKVLYVPTIAASVIACILMFMHESNLWLLSKVNPQTVGGAWLAVFFVNFLVEEYNVTIKVLLVAVVGLVCLFLWLHLLGWVGLFLRMFGHLALSISGTGYLIVAIVGVLTVFISWFKGLFYYITITPNYMNLQQGPTESGEQISREDYNTKIDTSDFLERLLGFGKIIITFRDNKRQPVSVLVWRIAKRAQLLEKVRAKLAIDHARTLPTLPTQ